MRKALAAAAMLALVPLSGCGSEKYAEHNNDSPRTGNTDKTPAAVMAFPDGFSNVATKCDGPNRVYVVFHEDSPFGSVSVVPNDPRCTK